MDLVDSRDGELIYSLFGSPPHLTNRHNSTRDGDRRGSGPRRGGFRPRGGRGGSRGGRRFGGRSGDNVRISVRV